MKKTLTFMSALILFVLTAQGESVTWHAIFDTSQLSFTEEVVDSVTYLKATCPGYDLSGAPGAPELPIIFQSFHLPTYAKNIRLSCQNKHIGESRLLRYPIYPVQISLPCDDDSPDDFITPDSVYYSANYPSISERIYSDD